MVLIAIDLENRVPLLISVPQDEDGLAARLRSFNIQSPQQYVILAPRGVHLGENSLGIANDLSGLKSPKNSLAHQKRFTLKIGHSLTEAYYPIIGVSSLQ